MKERYEDESIEGTNIETTGKFGTGFMTTYLLSKVIVIDGVYEDPELRIYQKFQFTLDRDALTKANMIEKLKHSSQIFEMLDDQQRCPRINDYEQGKDFYTSFKYNLNSKGFQAA